MKVYHSFEQYRPVPNPILTVGTFDGVHYGHQKILERLKDIARQNHGETVILTFFPHPRMILHPEDTSLKLLSTVEEKIRLLEKAGIDHLLLIPFTRDFSNLSSIQFIEEILVKTIGVKKLVIGYDHRFGKNREGTFEELKANGAKYGFDVEEIPEQDINHVAVSSTKIRTALASGKAAIANEYLGYAYPICGQVVKGDQLGRKLGYPTANLFVEESYKLIPRDGIYAVNVLLGARRLQGMLYIGHRPTINGMARNIEVNIFDFREEIYYQRLTLELLKFIREDQKFDTLEALTAQIGRDKEDCLQFFASR
ncbi:riboflavin kinase/FMN adenylyltransferase [Anseongella ginsenosidimutans]|uniref:Riboflavin biosynthesis protein n=1 Tax=Anseongella ginsenosidimutans TaxID=496056 RepID=A0A4R3KPC0_9SPHI|nr:bifunctional riboflavin kinase/FAD synthetase [Anseongella ginsenosidimutans]QEC52593.1 bifunctional riboflavin kinase/FAD synthetase [Anseongella ginsenosidimutans]TCS86512.1 riboflavin kinase/FMN adenylyltransferase [Anseongella ginsenosidimutans]